MSKLFGALSVLVMEGTVPTPPAGAITIFARPNKTLWVKYPDGTEGLLSVN
tara:strand:+ start:646 stop:798 length:153 start_codon:yes stop_codon:yes gene_type:complete